MALLTLTDWKKKNKQAHYIQLFEKKIKPMFKTKFHLTETIFLLKTKI